MRLIDRIEINYLRSLYSASADNVGDLSIIFGRNDSGKSNLLRALNLFFNNQIEPNRELDFDLDMSDYRKQAARDAKGKQFIWIKITFNVPSNYQSSLGSQIAIKRQWNKDSEMNQWVFPTLEDKGKQSRLTRFINDINFTYIPAVKDLTVYADLIERMYSASAETDTILNETRRFVDVIEKQTSELSDQLSRLFGSPTHLAPPTEMSRLFRNLDFAHGEDGHSLLRQKGDGIKARHLPELLRFINDNESRKKFYIWGFEEPENSLDLGAAEAEARRFAEISARNDTQIFITSHSPAFYLLDADDKNVTRRYFINKQIKDEEGNISPKNAASSINTIEDAELSMEKAGLLQLPFVIRNMGEQRRALKLAEDEANYLRRELSILNMPCLFVEGKHDVPLFEDYFDRLGIKDKIQVKPLGGTPSTTDALLGSLIEQGGLRPNAPTLLLFDDDKAGRAAFRKVCNSNLPTNEPASFHGNVSAWALQWTDEFKKFIRKHSINRDQAFFTAEFLYPATITSDICYKLIKSEKFVDNNNINGDYWPGLGQKKCLELQSAEPGSTDWFFARGVPDQLKEKFHRAIREQTLDTAAIDSMAHRIAKHLLS